MGSVRPIMLMNIIRIIIMNIILITKITIITIITIMINHDDDAGVSEVLGGGEDVVSEEGGGPGKPQEAQTGKDHNDHDLGGDLLDVIMIMMTIMRRPRETSGGTD